MLLMNIMASRVFRDTNLGYLKQFHVENDNILHSQLEGQINTNRPPSSVEPIQFRNWGRRIQSEPVRIRIESQDERHLDEKPEYTGLKLGHGNLGILSVAIRHH